MEHLLAVLKECDSIKIYGTNKEGYFAEVYSLNRKEYKSFEEWYSCEAMLIDILEWLTRNS